MLLFGRCCEGRCFGAASSRDLDVRKVCLSVHRIGVLLDDGIGVGMFNRYVMRRSCVVFIGGWIVYLRDEEGDLYRRLSLIHI